MSDTILHRSARAVVALTFLVGVAAGLVGLVRAHASGSQVLLEDFSAPRLNGEGGALWGPYAGAGSDYTRQVGSLDAGSYRVTIAGSGRPYFQFFPYPYLSPNGFAKAHILSGAWNPGLNRLRFWIKTTASIGRRSDGGPIAEVGTYSKPNDGQPSNQGSHFYHFLNPNLVANHWMLVTLNRVPQHQVGKDSNTNWPENPTAPGVNYYDGLTRFYFCDEYGNPAQWGNSDWWFKDFEFDLVTGEPDTLVSTVTAVYTGARYELSWSGPKNSAQSYTVRYSTTSMKLTGFASGTSGGAAVSNTGNSYVGVFWASAAMPEFATGVYMAIQPVGQTAFTEIYLPTGPGVDPLPPPSATPPSPPGNLRIVS